MKGTFKHLTKGEITASALKELRYRGFDCWLENNIAIRRRKFTGRLGKPDIIGFHQHFGQFLGCEVKTINDEFSDEQIIFLNNLSAARGAAYVAYQAKTGQLIVEQWHKKNLHPTKNNG
jgi:hypothetical protein